MSKQSSNTENRTSEFGELLREARAAAGQSVRDLEKATQKYGGFRVSSTMVSLIETGTRPPSFETAYVLAKVLSIDIETALSAALRSRLAHLIKREECTLDALVNKMHLKHRVDAERVKSQVNITKSDFTSS